MLAFLALRPGKGSLRRGLDGSSPAVLPAAGALASQPSSSIGLDKAAKEEKAAELESGSGSALQDSLLAVPWALTLSAG